MKKCLGAVALPLILCVQLAWAQLYVPSPASLPMSSFIDSARLEAASKVVASSGHLKIPPPPRSAQQIARERALVFYRTTNPNVPEQLAGYYPEEQQQEIEDGFEALLDKMEVVEDHFEFPANDVGVAAGFFIAVNYEAYNHSKLNEPLTRNLILQMRSLFLANPQLAKMTNAQKQAAYDEFVILGMLVVSLSENKEPQVQEASGNYLRTLLGVDPGRMRIDERGLSII